MVLPKLKEVLDLLDGIAPFPLAEEWDNAGLQIGYLSQDVGKILVALDPTVSAVRYASDIRAQLLLTHHPLLFPSLKCVDLETYPGAVISEAFQGKISIVAAHTNLDIAEGGINDMLTELFNLERVEVLLELRNLRNGKAGMGRIGHLPEPMRLSSVVEMAKKTLETTVIRVLGQADLEVSKIAVVGGSGGGMISKASTKGADLLITGDIRHHEALQAKALGLALIDGGHFYTERSALKLFSERFGDILQKAGWDVAVDFYVDERCPMGYQ